MSLLDVNTGDKITLKRLQIFVDICSVFSRTTITAEFFNPKSESINEAEFVAVLTDGSTVSGYSTEVGGVLVDAVIVPKEKARSAFAAETRASHKSKTSVVGLCSWTFFSLNSQNNLGTPSRPKSTPSLLILPSFFNYKSLLH